MNELIQYPYLTTYPGAKVAFDLDHQRLRPTAIAMVRGVENPDGVIHGSGHARFLASQGTAQLLLDFGEERVGHMNLTVRTSASCKLICHYGEYPDEAMADTPSPVSYYMYQRDEYTLPAGTHTLRSRGRRGFRFLRLQTESAQGDVELLDVHVEAVLYPLKRQGLFQCDDERINRVWEICCRTTRLCMQQFYEDGTKRDGLLWIGDYRLAYLCNVGAFGDAALARKSLFMIAATQRSDGAFPACAARGGGHQHPHNIEYMGRIPQFVQDWVLLNYCTDYVSAIREYLLHSGDTAILLELWPSVQRLMRYLLEDVDWETIEPMRDYITDHEHHVGKNGFHSYGGVRLQLHWALKDAEYLARRIGDAAKAEVYRQEKHRLKERLVREHWNAEEKLFEDDPPCRRNPDHPRGVHVQALAILSGLIDDPREGRELLLRAWNNPRMIRAETGYARFFVLQGLFQVGLEAQAIAEIRRAWGKALDCGLTTCPETLREPFNDLFPPGEPFRTTRFSLCHAWSAGPNYFLPAYVLGVQPMTEGYRQVRLRPALGELHWAEGRLPTPAGDIFVRWEQDKTLRGEIFLPTGVTGAVQWNHDTSRTETPLWEGWNRF